MEFRGFLLLGALQRWEPAENPRVGGSNPPLGCGLPETESAIFLCGLMRNFLNDSR
jgi:hypothetical protein